MVERSRASHNQWRFSRLPMLKVKGSNPALAVLRTIDLIFCKAGRLDKNLNYSTNFLVSKLIQKTSIFPEMRNVDSLGGHANMYTNACIRMRPYTLVPAKLRTNSERFR